MNIDDKQPTAIPTISGNTNSLRAADVIMYKGTITTNVVIVVISDLDNV